MREPDKTDLDIPGFSLVVLIGSTGSGKSTFAARHFLPTEIVSSDRCRGLVCDDETNQDVSADAFELMRDIIGKRLKHRKLAVVDATNVRAADRKAWIELARRWHALPVAIILDPGVDVCVARNANRPDRPFGAGVAQRMTTEIRKGLGGLQREGFRQVWKLGSEASIDAAKVFISDAAERVEHEAKRAIAAVHEGDMLTTQMAVLKRFGKRAPVNTIALRRKVAAAVQSQDRDPFEGREEEKSPG